MSCYNLESLKFACAGSDYSVEIFRSIYPGHVYQSAKRDGTHFAIVSLYNGKALAVSKWGNRYYLTNPVLYDGQLIGVITNTSTTKEKSTIIESPKRRYF